MYDARTDGMPLRGARAHAGGRTVAPPVMAALKKNAAAASTMSEADQSRVAELVLQGLLKHEHERNTVVTQLLSKVSSLESRVNVLEQQQAAAEEQKRQQQAAQVAAAEKMRQKQAAAERNRARQLNPACTVFWTSRGYDDAPWNWENFANTNLNVAHRWPGVLAVMEDGTNFDTLNAHYSSWNIRFSNEVDALRDIYDDDDLFDD